MKQSLPPIPDLIAHEILIFGVIFVNAWAISLFEDVLGIRVPCPALLILLYLARLCVGAYRHLGGLPFTFSSRRVYPSLFTTALLFLASAYAAFYYSPQVNEFLGIPVSRGVGIFFAWCFAIVACVFFIRRQVRIAWSAGQESNGEIRSAVQSRPQMPMAPRVRSSA